MMNQTPTTKKILIIVTAALLIIAVAVGTVLILRSVRSGMATQKSDDKAVQAEAAYDKAQHALKDGNYATAKASFEQAREYYNKTNDTGHLKDIEAAISLIDHASSQTTASPPEAPGASTPAK
jgi:outer membrane protein assembly factor BamD (BamD/ComL family)